ncbi:MAG: MMPL family transporter [Treponema sp.]|jgi:predicted RND superfamily exporter protein|nr:MMPL family transporter [Treponema sp.]
MERFFRRLMSRPVVIVCVIGAITLFFAAQFPRAQLDNNNLRFVPVDEPARVISAEIDETFGSSLFILVGLERPYGTIFDPAFLQLIREYRVKIEDEIEIVGTINSIVNADYLTVSPDGAIVAEELISPDFAGTDEEIAELRRRILSWDLYKRTLISDDWTATQFIIPLDIDADDAGNKEVVESFLRIRDIARDMFKGSADVYVAGMPVLSATINEAVNADLILLVPLVIIVVLTVLFFSFRRLTAVCLPLLTVVIATVWAVGAMPLFHIKLTILSTVLPVILVAVGSAYGIHVVTHYLKDRGKASLDNKAHIDLIITLLMKIGKPIFLAALTTFVGFVSFCFTRVVPIREFGIFASFGVVTSFVIAVTLIPALFILRGPRLMPELVQKKQQRSESHILSNALTALANKKITVLVGTGIILIIALYGLSHLIIDNVMVEYFRDSTDVSRSDKFIREKFGGSKVVSIVVEADSAEILLGPDSLRAIDALNTYLMTRVKNVGKTMGFTDLIKRINQIFNTGEDPSGLAPLVSNASDDSGSSDGFGFGDFGFDDAENDFGFGDFGFDNAESSFGFDGIAFDDSEGADIESTDQTTYMLPRSYTADELIALFDRAAYTVPLNGNDLVHELRKLINYEGAAYYEIPYPPQRYGKQTNEELQQLVSNYLVLLSGSIAEYANDPLQPTAIKTTVQMQTVGQIDTDIIIKEIHDYIAVNFPKNLRVTVGGTALVENSINELIVQSQLVSVITSLMMVFLIISVSNTSIIAGFIGIIPLSLSILINFAVMGFFKIKLDIGTSMIAAISVGVGIDYTIHYIESYKREYQAGGENFLWRTFNTAGNAIIINAISVGAGFAVLILSRFVMLGNFGLLVALTMFTSAFISLTVIPVLLTVLKPKFLEKK